ncbi:transposase [Nocardia donostiensis]|uniref:transposase n=1 Tax=Nocardia donostiensis TaxID=1538463 RepID=UPI001FE6EFC5|nr:transposase [Nocardia donostiensis]
MWFSPPGIGCSRRGTCHGWLKGVSSRWLRQEFLELVQHYRRAQHLWFGSYFAGPVDGAAISVLWQYIEQQNRPVQLTLDPGGVPRGPSPPPLKYGTIAYLPVADRDGAETTPAGYQV